MTTIGRRANLATIDVVLNSTRSTNLSTEGKVIDQVGEAEQGEEHGKVQLPLPLHRKAVRSINLHVRNKTLS